jgi:hypothetical protein
VQAVVEGSVLRSGDKVRINAELVDAEHDKHLWAQSFEGDLREILGLQREVARSIVSEVRVTLNLEEKAALRGAAPVNPEALQDYLKGRFFASKRTAEGLKSAIEHFKSAIAADPSYAQAFSGLADAYALAGDWEYQVLPPDEAYRLAKAAATRALALDNSLGEAHTSLAFALDLYGRDWPAPSGNSSRLWRSVLAMRNCGYGSAGISS